MKALQAHEVEAVVAPDGTISVHDLPFVVGERVRVLVMSESESVFASPGFGAAAVARSAEVRREMQGLVIRYDEPDEPAGADDWEATADGRQS